MSVLNIPTLVIEPDVMQQALETQSFNLAVPDDESKVKKGRNKFGPTAQWTELLTINTSEIGTTEPGINANGDSVPERVFVDVKFAVAPETLDPKNVGRTVKQRYLINPAQLGNKQSSERIMSLMSIGKLNALLRAAGFEIEQGVSTDLGAYFTPNASGESQVSGIQVYADFRNHTDKSGTPRQEIVSFDSVDSAGA